jgi:hypothetical protein
MPEADPKTLMNLNFKGTNTDGGLMTQFTTAASDFDNTETGFDTVGFDTQVNSGLNQIVDGGTLPGPSTEAYQLNAISTSDPLGYGLRDPYVSSQHPEERIPVICDDVLNLKITSNSLPGAAPQTTKYFDVSSYTENTVTLFHGAFAPNSESILVWRDGIRLTVDEYNIDFFGRTVTPSLINSDTSKASSIVVKIFGIGGSDAIIETDYFAGNNTNTLNISTPNVQQQQLLVSINGFLYPSTSLSIVNETITLPVVIEPSDDVAVYVFETNSTTYSNLVNQQNLIYNSQQTWTLNYPDTQTIPAHAGTIVEVNGLRLLPPLTYYGTFDILIKYLNFDVSIQSGTTIQVFVNQVFYPYQIPTVTAGSSNLPFGVVVPNGQMPNNSNGMFAIYGQQLISLDPNFTANEVCLVIHQDNDFEISDGTLTISKSLQSTDNIFVTTFSNASIMGIKTHTYLADSSGEYLMYSPFGNDYTWATIDGKILVGGKDYSFTKVVNSYPITGFGPAGENINLITSNKSNLTFAKSLNLISNEWLVVTVFTVEPLREKISWIATTNTPAAQRMVPVPDRGGFGLMPFGIVGFDEKVDWQLTISNYEISYDVFDSPVSTPVYKMNNSWEYLRADNLYSGILLNQLNLNDTEITISLYDANVSPKLAPTNPFYVPEIPPYSFVQNFTFDGNTIVYTVNQVGDFISVIISGNEINSSLYIVEKTFTSTTIILTEIIPSLGDEITITISKPKISQIPGVVFIHGERIEYWDIETNGSTVVLSNIRRATRGTSSCSEQRYVSSFMANTVGPYVFDYVGNLDIYKSTSTTTDFVGDGLTETFNVYNTISESLSGLSVTVNGTLVSNYVVANNVDNISITFNSAPALNANIVVTTNYNIWLIENIDFTQTISSNSTSITFNSVSDCEIVIGFALGNYVPVGTIVRNGMQDFIIPVPFDETSGNRDIQPIKYLIEN